MHSWSCIRTDMLFEQPANLKAQFPKKTCYFASEREVIDCNHPRDKKTTNHQIFHLVLQSDASHKIYIEMRKLRRPVIQKWKRGSRVLGINAGLCVRFS